MTRRKEQTALRLVLLSQQAGRAVTLLERLKLLLVVQLEARPVDDAAVKRAREEALLDIEVRS